MKSQREVIDEFIEKYKKSFGGWVYHNDMVWLVEFLQKISSPKTMVEIGIFMGASANVLLYLCPNAKYYGIDNWAAGEHQAKPLYNTLKDGFLDNTMWAKDRVTLVEGDSIEVGKKWDIPIDFLYIDGDHTYKYAKADIENFVKWLEPNGYILIDDYETKEVIQAVDELIRYSSSYEVLRVPEYHRPNFEKLFVAKKL